MSDKKELKSDAIEKPQSSEVIPEKVNHTAKNANTSPENQAKQTAKTADKAETATNQIKEKVEVKTESTQKAKAENKASPAPSAKTEKTETIVVKKGGSALSLLALLVALGLGGAGYYFGQQEVFKIHQKITALEQQTPLKAQTEQSSNTAQLQRDIEALSSEVQNNHAKLHQLESALASKEQAYVALQNQLKQVASTANAQQPNDWLLSEADFLLSNALRKLLLDNDVETSISLLKVADEVLSKVSLPEAQKVRVAITQDLKQLLSVNRIDQNEIMQRLSQLANNIDELMVLNVNFAEEKKEDKVSDDVADWKTNLQKSASSFLNHFIRITPRAENSTQALLAPNQDIYLRENIRLRLQIAILAVPRQQDELYKQSLETVSAWVRSYFDTQSETAVDFLKSLDELAEQSIYVEVPTQLHSLNALDKLLNKTPEAIQKIEISADKALTEANQVAAQEIKQSEEVKQTEESKSSAEVKPEQSAEQTEQQPASSDATPATQQ